jgi:tripartite-type tricarboxylate transporter receptor subunit TctC
MHLKNGLAKAALAVMVAASPVLAEDDDFVSGKAIRIVTTGTPGGQSDQMARIFADAITRRHPETSVRVDNMRTQGNVVAMKDVYDSGPKEIDIAIISAGIIFKQMTDQDLPFDLSEMKAIGSLASSNYMLAIRNDKQWDLSAKKFTQEQLQIGVHYRAASDYFMSQLLNVTTNLDIKAIEGFETDVMVTTLLAGDFNAILMGASDPVSQNFPTDLKPVLLIGQSQTYPDFANGAPRLRDVASNEIEMDIVNVLESISDVGRILLAEPGISDGDLTDLISDFEEIVNDENYLEANKKIDVSISPSNAKNVNELFDALLSSDSPINKKIQSALACGAAQADSRRDDCSSNL